MLLLLGLSHNPYPFYTRGYVYHRFRDCLVLADIIRSGYAYTHVKIDPKWNSGNQQPGPGHSSHGQSSSMHVARPVTRPDRGYGKVARRGGRVGHSCGRGQLSAMASVPRSATPPRYVTKVETHEPPNKMLPPNFRKGVERFSQWHQELLYFHRYGRACSNANANYDTRAQIA